MLYVLNCVGWERVCGGCGGEVVVAFGVSRLRGKSTAAVSCGSFYGSSIEWRLDRRNRNVKSQSSSEEVETQEEGVNEADLKNISHRSSQVVVLSDHSERIMYICIYICFYQ